MEPKRSTSHLYTEETHRGNLGDPDDPKTIAAVAFEAARGHIESEPNKDLWAMRIEMHNAQGKVIGYLTLRRSAVDLLMSDFKTAIERLDAEIALHAAEKSNGLHAC